MRLNFALHVWSENFKDGKVTVHSAKNTTKFGAIVGRSANHADQINLGVAAALRSNIYGGVLPRITAQPAGLVTIGGYRKQGHSLAGRFCKKYLGYEHSETGYRRIFLGLR